jgi:hypothetical protein
VVGFGVPLRASRTLLAALALVLMASAGVLASPAAAKSESYSGPLADPNYPPCDPAYPVCDPPRVELDVISKKNAKGKLRPVTVRKFKVNHFTTICSDGKPQAIGSITVKDIPVKHRRFAATGFAGTEPDDTYEVSGQIPREGPATGTFRWVWHEQPGIVSPALPCDSGVLSWSAEKTG